MATYVPAKINTQYIFYAGLVSQADTRLIQTNPTIASGDFKVSIDGGALANLGTLPAVTPASSKMVKFTLSTSEMNGANITVVCTDAAGAEWCDAVFNIQTAARQIDDLSYPATSGRSTLVAADGSVSPNWADVKSPTTTLALTGTTIATTQKVDVDTIKTNPVVNGGTITFPTTATLASTTNITAGTITTVTTTTTATNLTNAPTNGDFTATMKTSIGTAVAASAVASVTGNVGGNVTGSVGSVVGLTASNLDATVSSRLASASYTVPDNASVAAIKVTTDKFVFTVTNQVDANVQSINDATVQGDGTSGNLWRG